MAALTADARAIRMDAARLRSEARELRLTVHNTVACSHERLGRARLEAGKARAWRVEPLPSPWSGLLWTQCYDALDRTLVPLPPSRYL